MLCAGRNLDDGFSLEGWDFHFPTEHCSDEVDRHVTGDIQPLAVKDLMRSDGNRHVEVSGRASVGAMFSFIGETKPHAGLNTGRNMDGDGPLFINPLAPLAGRTGFRDKMTGAFT